MSERTTKRSILKIFLCWKVLGLAFTCDWYKALTLETPSQKKKGQTPRKTSPFLRIFVMTLKWGHIPLIRTTVRALVRMDHLPWSLSVPDRPQYRRLRSGLCVCLSMTAAMNRVLLTVRRVGGKNTPNVAHWCKCWDMPHVHKYPHQRFKVLLFNVKKAENKAPTYSSVLMTVIIPFITLILQVGHPHWHFCESSRRDWVSGQREVADMNLNLTGFDHPHTLFIFFYAGHTFDLTRWLHYILLE